MLPQRKKQLKCLRGKMIYPYGEWETTYFSENGDIYRRITDSPFHSEEEVKEKDELEYALQKRACDIFRKFGPDWHSRYRTIDIYERNNCYAVRLGTVGERKSFTVPVDKINKHYF